MKKFAIFIIFLSLFINVYAAEDIQVVLEQPGVSTANSGDKLEYSLDITLPENYQKKYSSFSVTVLMDKNLNVVDTSLKGADIKIGKVDVKTTKVKTTGQNIIAFNVNDISAVNSKDLRLNINTEVNKNIENAENIKNSFVLSYVGGDGNVTSDQKNLQSSTKTQNGKLVIKDLYESSTEIVGSTEKKAELKVFIDDKEYTNAKADEDGNFSMKVSGLKKGSIVKIYAKTKDKTASLEYVVREMKESYKAEEILNTEDKSLTDTIKNMEKLSDLTSFARDLNSARADVETAARLKAAVATSEYIAVKKSIEEEEIIKTLKELEEAIKSIRVPYMSGVEKDKFSPDGALTRAQAASIFNRIINGDSKVSEFSKFSDIKADKWYADDIAAIEKKGLINGYEDGTFRPEKPITRAEFAVIVNNYLKLELGEEPIEFKDVKENHWAKKYIDILTSRGILSGKSKDKFHPEDKLKRSESAVIFNRVLDRKINKTYIDKYSKNPYTDLKKNHWAYYEILEITGN